MINLKFSSFDNFDDIDSSLHFISCRHKEMGLLEDIPNGTVFGGYGFTINKTSDTKGLAWRRLDNRLDTYYGSTYEIPLSNYTTYQKAYRFWICGNAHTMHNSSTIRVPYVIPPDEEPLSYVLPSGNRFGSRNIYSYTISIQTLEDVIGGSYPSSVVTKYGNFSDAPEMYTLSSSVIISMLNDLNTIVGGAVREDSTEDNYRLQLPTHILLGGIEKEIADIGEFNNIVNAVKNIYILCRVWGIRLVIVTDPFYRESLFYSDFRDFIETMISDDCLLDIDKWSREARTKKHFPFNGDVDYSVSIFPDYVYHYICDKTIEKWQLPIHRDKYYVSLISERITDDSYDNYMKLPSLGHGDEPFVDKVSHDCYKLSIIQRESERFWESDRNMEQYHIGKYRSDDQSPNLFMNTGQRFVVIVHTGYSDTLWAHEQFQANTNYEFLCQTDTCGENYTGKNLINTMPIRRTVAYNSVNPAYHSAVYPGTGAPWFVASDDNIKDYSLYRDSDELNHMLFDCWLTFPDDMNCSITIRVRGNHVHLDNWQSISFGRFSYKQTENYSYSLYCAGGSLGISNDVYVYDGSYIDGNSYDLDFHNVSWGHPANLLNPTKFNGANTSNFKVLSIEGIWKNIYAGIQDAHIVEYPVSEGKIPDYATVLGSFRRYNGADHYIYPTGHSIIDTEITKYINSHGYSNIGGRNYIYDVYNVYNTQFIPIVIFFNKEKDHRESLGYASVPNVFCTFDREIPSGEYIAQDGGKYLIVPCGWEGRLYSYDSYDSPYGHRFKVLNEPWDACDVVELYEKNTSLRKEVLVIERLAIRIG